MSNNKRLANTRLIVVLLATFSLLHLRADDDLFKIPENAAKELPLGVPRTVDTNGKVIYIEGTFSTRAYQDEALRLVIQEANKVARDLQLPEALPITESNLTHVYIAPFGFGYQLQAPGNITTSNYWYIAKRGNKFSDLTVADIDNRCRDYIAHYRWPITKLDTNAAYQLAMQWLSKAHMDVQGLNRDYKVQITLDPYWNGVKMGQLPKKTFTPIYIVSWLSRGPEASSDGAVASVELFLPKQTLLSLSVDNPKYILRSPIVFTNLAALFPGKGTIITNRPTKSIIIDGSDAQTN
jgi:hypothetical protein